MRADLKKVASTHPVVVELTQEEAELFAAALDVIDPDTTHGKELAYNMAVRMHAVVVVLTHRSLAKRGFKNRMIRNT